jgi:polysaccharide deacetylase 2 family uncharacterized protein YibQ
MLAGIGVLVAGGVAGGAYLLTAQKTPRVPPPVVVEVEDLGVRAPAAPAAITDVTDAPPEVVVEAPGIITIRDPNAPPPVELAAAADPDLLATTAHGAVPRVGVDGRRPFEAYARPAASGNVRIALVIGGLGISQMGTRAAVDQLPPEVSLAFAPYGNDLEAEAARARAEGHELLLQIPLEPFDFPNTDPGEHTLTVAGPGAENRERLDWLLSRITTYVGVVNYMGGRFTSDAGAMSDFLAEIGEHGLMYVDDGSSQRSQVAAKAPGVVPFAKADVIIDATEDRQAIDAALFSLEEAAHANGSAIGFGSAYPLTVERIVLWAEAARTRGVTLVPVSALAIE